MVTFSTIVAYQKSQRNTHNGLQVTATECATRRGMSTRQIPPQLTHGATLPYRLNVLHVIVVTFSTIVAYPKSQRNMHNGLWVTVTDCATHRRYVYSANSTSAVPGRFAAISIECVICNCGDLFNDRCISIKPEKHA